MRLFMEDERDANKDIYARTLIAQSPDGDSSEFMPELSFHRDSETPGATAPVAIKDLSIGELMDSCHGF